MQALQAVSNPWKGPVPVHWEHLFNPHDQDQMILSQYVKHVL